MSHGAGGHSLEDAARDACARAGLEYRSGIPQDGNWHRLNVVNDRRGRDDGAIKLFPDGEGGIVWNWKTDYYEPFFRTRANPPTEAELAAQAKVRREAEQERERDRINARGRAKSLWEQGDPVGPAGHPYLTKKGVGDHGIRVIRGMRRGEGHDDTLVIPVWRAGELVTVQLIGTGGVKRFLKHSTPKGGYLILNRRDEGPGLIAEGFATSATLVEITHLMCVCAFSRGGLLATMQTMQEMFPGRQFIICGDYDRDGIKTAGEAARQTGSLLAIPDFSGTDAGKGDTDFNDLARLAGNGAVLDQIRAAVRGAPLEGGASEADSAGEPGRHANHQGGNGGDGQDMTQASPANKGESKGSNEKNASAISPGKLDLSDLSSIPPRDFLYADHYIRRYVSMTAAPGGTGKTAIAMTEALAMVTSHQLLGYRPRSPLRVWYIGEDDEQELRRRFGAIMKRYGIKSFEIDHGLFVSSMRALDMVIYNGDEKPESSAVQRRAAIIRAIIENRIDVIMADPMIRTYKGEENENNRMAAAMVAWIEVAERGNCAVELLAHARKALPGSPRTTEDMRGAGSQSDLARHVRLLTRMDATEAATAGIEMEECFRYVRFGAPKTNMTPALPTDWFRLDSVDLGNPRGITPADNVQVPSLFRPKTLFEGTEWPNLHAIMREIETGMYRKWPQSPDWAGRMIAEKLNIEATESGRKRINRMLAAWVKSGDIKTEYRQDAKREMREYYAIGNWDFSQGRSLPQSAAVVPQSE